MLLFMDLIEIPRFTVSIDKSFLTTKALLPILSSLETSFLNKGQLVNRVHQSSRDIL